MDEFYPVNTFATSVLDIFNNDGEHDSTIDLNKLSTIDMLESSCFTEAIDFVNESMRELTDSKIKLYRTISEATETRVVRESFSDFFTKARDIIKKFLNFLKSLFTRFVLAIEKFVRSDKYLTKHKKDLDKFNSDDKFDIDGFIYTFDPNIPSVDVYTVYNDMDPFKTLFTQVTDLSAQSVSEVLSNSALDANYDKFRARVLGVISEEPKEYIRESEFPEELFKKFRNGEANTSTIEVDTAALRLVSDRYFNSAKLKSALDNSYRAVERVYTNLERQISKYSSYNGPINIKAFINDFDKDHNIKSIDGTAIDANNGTTVLNSDLLIQLDNFIKIKLGQIQEYSNIHTKAFSAKLDAIKECIVQDRNTLYKALSIIAKNHQGGK